MEDWDSDLLHVLISLHNLRVSQQPRIFLDAGTMRPSSSKLSLLWASPLWLLYASLHIHRKAYFRGFDACSPRVLPLPFVFIDPICKILIKIS